MDSVHEQAWTPVHERQWTSTVQDLVDTLREQMHLMREELQAARDERGRLQQMLHEMQHRYDRLLEAPRSAPAPAVPEPHASRGTRASRGAMRRRIVALLAEHPDGLSPAQVRQELAVEKALSATMAAMARDGLLRRVGSGRYGAMHAH